MFKEIKPILEGYCNSLMFGTPPDPITAREELQSLLDDYVTITYFRLIYPVDSNYSNLKFEFNYSSYNTTVWSNLKQFNGSITVDVSVGDFLIEEQG